VKANSLQDANGDWRDVSKRPAADPTKGSKARRQAVIRENGTLVSVRLDDIDPAQDQLKSVWRNGELLIRHSFEQLRNRSEA
jgi:nicotinamide phosphoribosyltransferase